jgi:hypothetical protein
MAHRRATLGIALLVACALPASSPARMSATRAAKVRAELTRAVKRHPGVIGQRWFLRKAGLGQYKLPVTLRLRPDPAPTATADLGASLGSRSIALGGSLAADVVFSDTFDGGALGDVGIEFRQSDSQVLETSSIPLLWNTDASGCALNSGAVAGDDDWLGPSHDPFPSGASAPGDFDQPPDVEDTVLRTNALRLQVADRGTAASGGHANLFGNIPGKNVSVDVTLSLKTVINAVVRVLDDEDPNTVAQCRQLWTGATENWIPGIHLQGQLKIAPALMPDGHLRIAKVMVSSPPATPARVALSACLLPVSTYGDDPGAPADRPCGGPSDPGLGLAPLAAQDGAQVTVAGDISVDQVSVDVIIGDA